MAADGTARPGPETGSGLVNAAGWEMRCNEGGSDKYYRVVVADRVVIVNYGRCGAQGSVKVHRTGSAASARDQALQLTRDKEGKGYWLSRDTTGFRAEGSLLALARSGGGTQEETRASRDIIGAFTAAAPAGKPPVTGPLAGHVARGLDHALSGPAGPAAGGGSSPSAPRSRARTAVLKPAGDQVRPNGAVYKPRDLGGHEDIAVLREARGRHEHALLSGPPGTGKTALAEAAFAGPDGSGMETIGCTGDTAEADFVGTFLQDPAAGTWRWAPGPLHRSVLADVPLFVDEIALADPGVVPVLYPLMDGRGVLRIPMNPALDPIPVGPGWFVIAAYNPDAPGANMPDALRSRFVHHIEVESDWDLAAELGVPSGLITIARNLDGKRHDGLLSWSPQMRELLDFTSLAARYGTGYAAADLAAKAPAGPDREGVTAALHAHYPGVKPLSLGRRYGL